MSWKERVQKVINDAKEKFVELNINSDSIKYNNKIKAYREIEEITGDEEIVRAFRWWAKPVDAALDVHETACYSSVSGCV